ncbi:hypothetical protein PC128_g26241 [Phytophthora cactorum]|nr:hypothetical protein PC128_g26241 [Phytophthora cactorum]KAG4037978.1 hypothetical protein PC123_g26459 [Phytophthora cactorum]
MPLVGISLSAQPLSTVPKLPRVVELLREGFNEEMAAELLGTVFKADILARISSLVFIVAEAPRVLPSAATRFFGLKRRLTFEAVFVVLKETRPQAPCATVAAELARV